MAAKVDMIRCEDLECCQGLHVPCHLEIRSDSVEEAIRLMQAHAQGVHKVTYTAEQVRPHIKAALGPM